MGMDDGCAFCGKHYQSCKHYVKVHLPNKDGLALCGRKNCFIDCSDWYLYDIPIEDLCKYCVRKSPRAKAMVDGQLEFEELNG
jgi:hypothetical protein